MSYNTPKIINVFYKEDRKPYDENGKAISFFGEDFIGSHDATKIRFFFLPNQLLDGLTAIIHAKRADGQVRFEILSASSTPHHPDYGSYFELSVNNWFVQKTGKVTMSLKIYSGDITYGYTDDEITSIESITNAVVVASDIFSFNVGYAPDASEVAPPFDEDYLTGIANVLLGKPDIGQTIYVVPSVPEDLTGKANQWFLEKGATGNIGKLWHISEALEKEEVELGVGSVRLTTEGNGEVTADSGKLYFDNPNGTATLGLFNDVNLQIGQELHYYGKASGDITNGDIVQFAGIQGDHYLVKKAVPSEINANPQLIMGMATQDIANNAFGYVTAFGKVNNFDSKGFAVGSFIWFASGGATNGAWTTTEPTAPNAKVLVGVIVKAETSTPANNGVALIRPTIQPRLQDLQNVRITTPTAGDILRFNGTLWSNSDDLVVTKGVLDNLGVGVQNLESRMTTAENDIDQLETDVVDLDDRLDFIEVNGGIDFVKVADFSSLPSSGDARDRRIYLTEDTNKLYVYDTEWLEVRQNKLTSDNGEEDGLVETTFGTRITHSGTSDATALQVIQTSELGEGAIIEAINNDGIQFAVNKDGSVNAYGDLTIAGNLTVSGTTTTVNTQTLDVEDNIITINKNQTGTPETTLLSGIEVERGDQTNFQFVFQESSDLFKVGQVGDLQAVATREDAPTDKGVAFFNTSTNKFETSGNLKVNTSGQLEDVVIRNSVINIVPLNVNAIASTNTFLQQWQVNGANRSTIDNSGWYRSNSGVANFSGFNNSNINTSSIGTYITRNINDANPALTVNENQGTGNIANFQFAGANKLEITKDGFLTQNGTRLFHQTGGTSNTFFGSGSGRNDTTGTINTGIGENSLSSLTSGSANTGVGRSSLLALSTGTGNTGLGQGGGRAITTGSFNVFVGHQAGETGAWGTQLATASNSTAIGYQAYTDASNQMVFGNASVTSYLFGRGNNSKVTINGSTTNALIGLDVSAGLIDTASARFTRRGTFTDNRGVSVALLHNLTSGQMVDGFGSTIAFQTKDADGVDNEIGQLGTWRSGADNSGRLVMLTANAGTMSEKMTIMPNGNVGIGTSTPQKVLSIVTLSNDDGLQIRRSSITNNDYANLGFRISTDGTIGENLAEIRGVRTNRAVSADTDLRFATRSAGTLAERMTIRDDGMVGVGTTSPRAMLHTSSFVGGAVVPLAGSALNASAIFTNNVNAYGLNVMPSGSGDVHLQVQRFDGVGTLYNLNLQPIGGNVGIGTTTPSTKLEVSGTGNQILKITSTDNNKSGIYLQRGTNNDAFTDYELYSSGGNFRIDRIVTSSVLNRLFMEDATGNVGIGTDSPTAQLQVKSGATTRIPLIVDTLASHTANLAEYKLNTSTKLVVTKDGKIQAGSGDGEIHVTTQGVRIETLGNNVFVPLTVNKDDMGQGTQLQQWQYGTDNVAYVDENGDFYNVTGTYGTISDLRVKENIVDARNYTEDLMKLRVVKYSLKSEESDTPTKLGFIAQEVEQVFPTMVQTTKTDELEDMKSIKMSVLIPMLVKTIQELKLEIDELKKK